MALYEVEEAGMRKFYRIEREGTRVVLTWGRIGTNGQRKVLELASEPAAEAEYQAQILRRRGRGYWKVVDESLPHDSHAARVAEGAARLAAATPLTTAPRFLFVHPRRGQFVWLEQRGVEVWSASGKAGSEADAVPEAKALGSVQAAARHQSQRVAKLLADGYVLDAFDAKPEKRVKKPAPSSKPKPKTKATKAKPTTPVPGKPFAGQRFAFFGEFAVWPSYHRGMPATIAKRLGASIADELGDDVDCVVFGDLRGAGRSEAKKLAEKLAGKPGARIKLLDESAYRELVRVDLTGKRFAFVGGFDCSPSGLEDGLLVRMVEAAGGIVQPEVDATLDYLVSGNRRGPSKIALQNKADKLIDEGAPIKRLDETAFLELVRVEKPAVAGGELDFAGFLSQLYGNADEGKLGRALDMLRKDRFQLYSHLDDGRLIGVVRSQSRSGSVYASWLTSDGHYGCAQSDLAECMGLQGTTCKHLLVLVVGLARTGQLAMPQALQWIRAANGKGPRADTNLCAETFIQYKGAEAGEVDWRPTETIPEDFYAL